MNAWLRTAAAILAGFLLMVLIVMVGTIVATTFFVTEEIAEMRELTVTLPAGYLVANLVISLLAAVAGGWLASRLDGPGRWRPVLGMAALVFLTSLFNMRSPAGSGGTLAWYPWVILVIGVAGTLLGGWSRMRSVEFPAIRDSAPPA